MDRHLIKVLMGLFVALMFCMAGCADIESESPIAKPGFTVDSNGTIYDPASKLVWLNYANCFDSLNWHDAVANTSTLSNDLCRLSDASQPGDWRLPTIEELSFFIDAGYRYDTLNTAGFTAIRSGIYLSSSTYENLTDYVWSADFGSGLKSNINKTSSGYVWPVRARFIDRGKGTIYDSVKKMTWLKDANCFGTQTWDNAMVKASTLADGQCGLSDGSVAGNWRLPTIDELSFILDAEYPTKSAGFTNIMDYVYLSSSPYEGISNSVWSIDMGQGIKGNVNKAYVGYIWPVRTGL